MARQQSKGVCFVESFSRSVQTGIMQFLCENGVVFLQRTELASSLLLLHILMDVSRFLQVHRGAGVAPPAHLRLLLRLEKLRLLSGSVSSNKRLF